MARLLFIAMLLYSGYSAWAKDNELIALLNDPYIENDDLYIKVSFYNEPIVEGHSMLHVVPDPRLLMGDIFRSQSMIAFFTTLVSPDSPRLVFDGKIQSGNSIDVSIYLPKSREKFLLGSVDLPTHTDPDAILLDENTFAVPIQLIEGLKAKFSTDRATVTGYQPDPKESVGIDRVFSLEYIDTDKLHLVSPGGRVLVVETPVDNRKTAHRKISDDGKVTIESTTELDAVLCNSTLALSH